MSQVVGVATGLPAPPDAGRGGSDGPGTYRRISDGNYDIVGGGTGKCTPTQSTVVEAIEDDRGERPCIVAGVQSTVVEAIEDGQPVVLAIKDDPRFDDWRPAKRDWDPVVEQSLGMASQAVPQCPYLAESSWPLFSVQEHKADAKEIGSPWTRPERTSSYSPGREQSSSSSGWWSGAGWKTGWDRGWYAGWQTGWRQ